MRFFLPLALLGATALAETAQDVLNKEIPACMRTCLGDAFEEAIGCSLDDNQCVCNADEPSNDKTQQIVGDVQDCVASSNCTKADFQQLEDLDFNKIYTEGTKDICSGGVALSATNVVFAAGTMAFLALI
ncbi:hypothetical protein BDV18DRAFT_129807 [Aspergillus unguis]